ncbi:MAG: clostripain-related cysteine peptidase [Prevotella sp.]|nr:clostripain-related cysteine peptidase [Bacteroides sp.]MCM1366627.1 clostripain-related cysteine peptidase [Prevotella sp.]MCM1436992.1 clostripain-related cysteine peptidase [Prevotella sp.]
MKKFILSLFVALSLPTIFSACSEDEPTPPEPMPPIITEPENPDNPQDSDLKPDRIRTIVVYAVASNNLSADFNDDCKEMLEGMKGIDNEKYSLLLYRVVIGGDVDLLEVKNSEKGLDFVSIKEYDNNTLSTDPDRLSQVISDVKELRPAQNYGLIFWAHGSSWEPGSNSHGKVEAPMLYAYGGDESTGVRDWMNIDEMAQAIPDKGFEFIWFDNCFMSSIEVLYQLRNKSEYIVAYPTEIYSPGMPYHATLPLLMQPDCDLVNAAVETFDSYNAFDQACTIAVMDMSEIEPVAEAAAKACENFKILPTTSGIQVYSRFSYGPYFDFVQLYKMFGSDKDSFSADEFDVAMSKFVIYKACSNKDFNNRPIDKNNYSGISAHHYKKFSNNDYFYTTLDWYHRVLNGY